MQNKRAFIQRDAFIRTRTNQELKIQAEEILSRLGMNLTDAINLFLVQVTLKHAIPFDVSLPFSESEKSAEFEERKRKLNEAIAQGQADIDAGRVLTVDQSKERSRAKLKSLQEKYEQKGKNGISR